MAIRTFSCLYSNTRNGSWDTPRCQGNISNENEQSQLTREDKGLVWRQNLQILLCRTNQSSVLCPLGVFALVSKVKHVLNMILSKASHVARQTRRTSLTKNHYCCTAINSGLRYSVYLFGKHFIIILLTCKLLYLRLVSFCFLRSGCCRKVHPSERTSIRWYITVWRSDRSF